MEKVLVEISYSENNFCAQSPLLPGCVSIGFSLAEVKKNIAEAISFHVEESVELGFDVPEVFLGEYELCYTLSTEALLNAYSGIFTKSALSKITGINERQLWHYAAGVRKPRKQQKERIEQGLHELANQLLAVHL